MLQNVGIQRFLTQLGALKIQIKKRIVQHFLIEINTGDLVVLFVGLIKRLLKFLHKMRYKVYIAS